MSSVDFIVTLQRGTEWAATGAVTQNVPANFPAADAVSARADIAAMEQAAAEPGEPGVAAAAGHRDAAVVSTGAGPRRAADLRLAVRLLPWPRRDGRRERPGSDARAAGRRGRARRQDRAGVRVGRVDKGMPAFQLGDADLAAIVAFIHDQKNRAASLTGGRRGVDVADLQTGNADAGRSYFNGACASCHAPGGDLAGIANRLQGLALLQRMLYPAPAGGAPSRAKVTVTTAAGGTVAGTLAYRDEFTIALTDSTGSYRAFPVQQVKFTVDDPLQAHIEQLRKVHR